MGRKQLLTTEKGEGKQWRYYATPTTTTHNAVVVATAFIISNQTPNTTHRGEQSMSAPTFTEQSAAYREGAQAYNEGKSWRENPHTPESGLSAPWRMGFNDRKQQVTEIRAQRAAAAENKPEGE